MAPVEEEFFKS